MNEFQPPPSNASALPAADVQAVGGQTSPVVHEAYPVRRPEADVNEFIVQVRASTLNRCRSRLTRIANMAFPWHELALGVCTLAIGAFLGALPANLKPESRWTVFFYTIMPVLGVGSGVAFLFLRKKPSVDAAADANEVLRELPDPDKTR